MAVAVVERAEDPASEPERTVCGECLSPVLTVLIPAVPKLRRREQLVLASPYEWEARTRCYLCANNAARVGQRCPRCAGKGHLGGVGRTGGPAVLSARALRGEEPQTCARCDGLGTIGAPRRSDCRRCGGAGYVGEPRPPRLMLAVDIAWSDEGHVRLIGPETSRRKGEALYELHVCGHSC